MKVLKLTAIFLSTVLVIGSADARSGTSTTSTPVTTDTSTTTTSSTPAPETSATKVYVAPTKSGNSSPNANTNMNESIRQNVATNNEASDQSTAMTIGFTIAAVACCSSRTCGYCGELVTAAGVSAYIASTTGNKAGQNAATLPNFTSFSPQGSSSSGGADGSSSSGSGPKSTSGARESRLKESLATLKSLGATVNTETGTVSLGGKTYTSKDLMSPESMAKAGLNPAAFGKLQETAKKSLEKVAALNPNVLSGGDDSSGGGGGSGGKSASAAGYAPPSFGLPPTAAGAGIDRKPADVQGLKSSLNGEPIGVAADDIFGIIDRRYDLHKNLGSFISQ